MLAQLIHVPNTQTHRPRYIHALPVGNAAWKLMIRKPLCTRKAGTIEVQ